MSGGGGPYLSMYIGQRQERGEQEVEPRGASWELQGPRIQQEPQRGLVCLTLGGLRDLHWMKGLWRLDLYVQVCLVL